MSIFNKPYKSDEELMEDKNMSELVRNQLSDNGEITLIEVCKMLGREPSRENQRVARIMVLNRTVKGKLEKEGKTLTCDNGRYFIVEDDKDAENEANKRKNRAIAHIEKAKQGYKNLNVTNPRLSESYIEGWRQVALHALTGELKKIFKLKG